MSDHDPNEPDLTDVAFDDLSELGPDDDGPGGGDRPDAVGHEVPGTHEIERDDLFDLDPHDDHRPAPHIEWDDDGDDRPDRPKPHDGPDGGKKPDGAPEDDGPARSDPPISLDLDEPLDGPTDGASIGLDADAAHGTIGDDDSVGSPDVDSTAGDLDTGTDGTDGTDDDTDESDTTAIELPLDEVTLVPYDVSPGNGLIHPAVVAAGLSALGVVAAMPLLDRLRRSAPPDVVGILDSLGVDARVEHCELADLADLEERLRRGDQVLLATDGSAGVDAERVLVLERIDRLGDTLSFVDVRGEHHDVRIERFELAWADTANQLIVAARDESNAVLLPVELSASDLVRR